MRGTAGAVAGSALLGSVSTPASAGNHYPSSDKDAIVSAPSDGGNGNVQWNSNLQWSQAMYLLLVESDRRGTPFGLAPSS